jgi:hypothetical protein
VGREGGREGTTDQESLQASNYWSLSASKRLSATGGPRPPDPGGGAMALEGQKKLSTFLQHPWPGAERGLPRYTPTNYGT